MDIITKAQRISEVYILFQPLEEYHLIFGCNDVCRIIWSYMIQNQFIHFKSDEGRFPQLTSSNMWPHPALDHLSIADSKITAVCLKPNSSLFYILNEMGNIFFYDYQRNVLLPEKKYSFNSLMYHGCMDIDSQSAIFAIGSIEGVCVYRINSFKQLLKIDCYNAMKVGICSRLNVIAVLQKQGRRRAVIHFFDLTFGHLVQTFEPTFLPSGLAFDGSFLVLEESQKLMNHVYGMFPSSLVLQELLRSN